MLKQTDRNGARVRRHGRVRGKVRGTAERPRLAVFRSITHTYVDPKTYRAVVDMMVAPDVKLPKDSSAQISTDGLLGGKVIALVPGGDDKMLADGGEITITQSAASLEDLLGKFIFGVNDLSDQVRKTLPSPVPAK